MKKKILLGTILTIVLILITSYLPYKFCKYYKNAFDIENLGTDSTGVGAKITYLLTNPEISSYDKEILTSFYVQYSQYQIEKEKFGISIIIFLQLIIIIFSLIFSIKKLVSKDSNKYVGIAFLISLVFNIIEVIITYIQ